MFSFTKARPVLESLKSYLPARFRKNVPVIPVVRLTGAIMAGSGGLRQNLSLASAAPLLHRAFSQKRAPAVAIVINSPGGSAVQSRLIFQRIRDLAEEKSKPVLVFVEDAAASGGYMIACAGDEIFVDPSSIVGSIGVVASGFGFVGLIEKMGVDRRVYTAGQNKVILDPFQPEKKADIAYLKELQLEIHETFIDLVKSRRGDKLADDADLFTGKFWTGKRGVELGLADGLGDVRGVLKARFGKDAKLWLVSPPRGLFGRRMGLGGTSLDMIGAGAAEQVMASVETDALWSRIGLNRPGGSA